MDGVVAVELGGGAGIGSGHGAPGHQGLIAAHGHHRGHVRGGVLGQAGGHPLGAIPHGGQDFAAVHHEQLLVLGDSGAGLLRQSFGDTGPGSDGGVVGASQAQLVVAALDGLLVGMGAGALPFPFVCADGVRECMNVFFPKGCAVPLHIACLGVLQLGGVLLRGDQVLVVEGAEIFGIALLGLQVDVALDAALLIDGRPAVRHGGDFLLDAVAVGVAQRGFYRGGELEQEQLVL